MFDRNTIIALVVVGIILLFLPKYYEWMSPPKPPRTEVVKEAQPDTTAPETTPVATHGSALPDSVAAHGNVIPDTTAALVAAHGSALSDATDPLAARNPYTEQFVQIETPQYLMAIGSNGLVSGCELKNYTGKAGENVKLFQQAAGPNPAIGFIDFDLGRSNMRSLSELGFTANTSRLNVLS